MHCRPKDLAISQYSRVYSPMVAAPRAMQFANARAPLPDVQLKGGDACCPDQHCSFLSSDAGAAEARSSFRGAQIIAESWHSGIALRSIVTAASATAMSYARCSRASSAGVHSTSPPRPAGSGWHWPRSQSLEALGEPAKDRGEQVVCPGSPASAHSWARLVATRSSHNRRIRVGLDVPVCRNAGTIVLPKATVPLAGPGAYLGSGIAGAWMACSASFRTTVCIRW